MNLYFTEILIRFITLDYRVIRSLVLKFKQQYFKGSKFSVLDIGCGTGALSEHFYNKAYLGFDLDPESISLAKSKHPKYSFVVGNVVNAPIGSKKFDCMLISGVIHHLDDLSFKKTMKMIQTHLNKKGKVLFIEAIPPIRNWNIIGRVLRGLDQGKHIRTLNQYVMQISKYLTVEKSFSQEGGLVDYGVIITGL